MRRILFALLTATLAFTPLHDEPTQNLIIYGGGGGSSFSRSCGSNAVLTGLDYRAGLAVDAVSLLCRPVRDASGLLGSETATGTRVGGGGGTAGITRCPSGSVVMGLRIDYGSVVNGLRLICRTWRSELREWASGETVHTIGNLSGTSIVERCSRALQPAIGIRGRSGLVIDAIGLVCNEP
jgi:hypothetical protein